MRRIRHLLLCSAVATVALYGRPSFAQSDAEMRGTARELGQQGQVALDGKDFKGAEDAFRRAEALFHAPTLLLGLARAQAGQGRFVEAWESYNRIILEGIATTPTFAKALEDAKAEIAAINGRRSRVQIAVTGADSAHVTVDDVGIRSEALGVPFLVNPGTHTAKATADGFRTALQNFTVAEGKTENVALTLERALERDSGGAPGGPTAAPAAPGAPVEEPAASASGAPHRLPAILAFSVGGAGLVAGVVTGILAAGKHSSIKDACGGSACPPTEQSAINSYHTMGLVSTVGFVVAGVGAAAGVVLWFAAPKGQASASSAAWIRPYVAPGTIGALGRF